MTDFADRMYVKNKAKDIQDMINIAASPGNYDYDPYMHGLANGLILAHSVLTKTDPVFLDPPEKWGYEKMEEEQKEKRIAFHVDHTLEPAE